MPNRPLLLLAALLSPLSTACTPQIATAAPAQQAGGAVSAADPRAAQAGLWVLEQGGSAADAAIATALALNVVEPQSSGIGGGGFLVYSDAERHQLTSFDGREEAPAAATPALFLDANGKPLPFSQAVPGGKSVGVPGNLRMWALAHAEHGRLPWAKLFEPAIKLARDGFEVTPRMHEFLTNRAAHAGMTAWARATYFQPDGSPRPVGSIIRNPELARTLETIAARGADWFYTGAAADALVTTVRTAARNPSSMTAGDLASYDGKEREALCGTYRGYRICGMGPPSSGAIGVFQILKQLERFDLTALGRDSPEAWHLIAESERLAYADRDAYVADPDYVTVPIAGLMDPAYLAQRSALISTDHAIPHVTAGTPPGAPARAHAPALEPHGTSHMVAVDGAGNVASMTSTIEGPYGSGLAVNGFFLNNELTDFSFRPEVDGALVANRVEGGKRPRSSMSPTIVYAPDGSVRIAIGAAGGSTIIAQVAKALIGVLDWGLTAQQAIALPQLFAIGDTAAIEKGSSLEAMKPALERYGHRVVSRALPLKANAVEWKNGGWVGAWDERSEGAAFKE